MKLLEEYENQYWVTEDWRIYSVRSDIFLKQSINHHWYLCVSISFKWKKKNLKVHRLVAKCFLQKIRWRNFVNHKDWNKLNCHKDNLEYTTRKKNIQHMYSSWLRKDLSTKWKPIWQFKDWVLVCEYRSVLHASKELSIAYSCIRCCVLWIRKTAGWSSFQYIK